MSWVFIALIKLYQYTLSPMLGPRCKYYPTCSSYAVEALREHGALRGLGLASWRLLRCNPLSNGGYDPVPPRHRHAGSHTHDHGKMRAHV
jgi:putative membrane protein insertion efficiency factor